ncbi:hypothetical protein HAX54_000974 [Datura stramonium]|uniref:Uncharacterized protein n=1 Tax=Datura stramonium TaxID=4076 RepID=A0ABS8T2N0_DATST|nr:hypothetical protein [Datura stramonium]
MEEVWCDGLCDTLRYCKFLEVEFLVKDRVESVSWSIFGEMASMTRPRSEIFQQKNKGFRLGIGMTEGMTARHTTDGGVDSCHPVNGPSPVPSRSGPFSFRVIELATDYQASDGSSWKLSPRPRFSFHLFQCDGRCDGPLAK